MLQLRRLTMFTLLAGLTAALTLALPGCDRGDGAGGGRQFLELGTAPIGGAFYPVGTALAEVLNANPGERNWKINATATKGTRENIRQLSQDRLNFALANSSITYHAVRGEMDEGTTYQMRTVMTLAPNVGHFITIEGSGVKTLADLKGKRVVVGPAGAGFEFFLKPLLAAHGVSYDDFSPLNNTQSGSVQMLGDGSADAAFLGGAMPQPSIVEGSASFDLVFIPFDEQARQQLIKQYPFFSPITVPEKMYDDLKGDFPGLNVGSMHVITSANADETLIYNVVKTLWEHRAESVKKHGALKFINEDNAARYTGTDFHPGAIKAYKELGIWPEGQDGGDAASDGGGDAADAGDGSGDAADDGATTN